MKRTNGFSITVIFCLCAIVGAMPHIWANAEDGLPETGNTGGIFVVIGCHAPQRLVNLRAENRVVQGLDTNEESVDKARDAILRKGLYGLVSADLYDGKCLPYTDNLINGLIAEDLSALSMEEVMRVLTPGGIVYIKEGRSWNKKVKPRPFEIDDWSHFFHNASGNPVSCDTRVGPPRHMQWDDGPRATRSHENMSSVSAVVSAGGRVFSIMDEGPNASVYLPSKWFLTARDAFNGVILWKKPIATWHSQLFSKKRGPFQLARRLVATAGRVYATLGLYEPLSEIDAATGEVLRTFRDTEHTEEVIHSAGKLILVVNDSKESIPFDSDREKRRGEYTIAVEAESRSIVVIDTASGKTLWRKESGGVTPITAIADQGKVFFHSDNSVRCLDLENGARLWQQPVRRQQELATNSSPALLVQDDVLCYTEAKRLTALSVRDGRQLWSVECAASVYRSPIGVIVIDGIIWMPESDSWADNKGAMGILAGYDLRTGEKSRSIPIDVEQGVANSHHRCCMPKAADKYLLTSWPGVEFTDTTTGKMRVNHWVRGACLFGWMPANGMVYAPPNPCACNPEGLLKGFIALAPERKKNNKAIVPDSERLLKGPAYSAVNVSKSKSNDAEAWPTFRHDNERSGSTPISISANLKKQWTKKIGGNLSQPILAEGAIYVASIDAHTLYALDAENGNTLWHFTAGGRVDSPPTYYRGTIILGSRDGFVYCLCAETGELSWKYNAALNKRKIGSFGQLESIWPVSGSVLIQDGSLYFASGRSSFLDGGIALYRMDPRTGETLSNTRIDSLDSNSGQPIVAWRSLPGALPDVLSSDGEHIYMRHIAFDKKGKRLDHPGNDHLYSLNGFLDRSNFHRSYWSLGKGSFQYRVGISSSQGVGGMILAMTKDRQFHFRRAMAPHFHLGADEEYYLSSHLRKESESDEAVSANQRGKNRKQGDDEAKKRGKVSNADEEWQFPSPMLVRAMLVADQTLFVAGPKGDWIHSSEAYEGGHGIALMAISAMDGKTLAELPLADIPVFDGMSAAYGKIYISDESGSISCFR